MQLVSRGISVPCAIAIVSYSCGGNIGNLRFISRVSGSTKDDMSQSLPIIESVKERMSKYHALISTITPEINLINCFAFTENSQAIAVE